MSKKDSPELSTKELKGYLARFRELSNSARFEDAYALASKLKKRYPKVLHFGYYEAVMTAEDITGLSAAAAKTKYKLAAQKFHRLLGRLRGASPNLRHSIRNEYYWFSQQPRKQFALGVEGVRKQVPGSYYSQGVGAAMLAKSYAQQGKLRLCKKWAKRSELAWKKYLKTTPDWFNAYFFYALALGLQFKNEEAEKALLKARLIADKPASWPALLEQRQELLSLVNTLKSTPTHKV